MKTRELFDPFVFVVILISVGTMSIGLCKCSSSTYDPGSFDLPLPKIEYVTLHNYLLRPCGLGIGVSTALKVYKNAVHGLKKLRPVVKPKDRFGDLVAHAGPVEVKFYRYSYNVHNLPEIRVFVSMHGLDINLEPTRFPRAISPDALKLSEVMVTSIDPSLAAWLRNVHAAILLKPDKWLEERWWYKAGKKHIVVIYRPRGSYIMLVKGLFEDERYGMPTRIPTRIPKFIVEDVERKTGADLSALFKKTGEPVLGRQ